MTASVNGTPLNTYYLNSKGYADSIVLDLNGLIHMSTNNTYDANGYLISQNESIDFLEPISQRLELILTQVAM